MKLLFENTLDISYIEDDHQWRTYLSEFLFSPVGSKYRNAFVFEKPIICGVPVPNITVFF